VRSRLQSLATDHSGRAGAPRTASARSGRLVSAPAGNRGGLRAAGAHPPRLLRWTLAPARSIGALTAFASESRLAVGLPAVGLVSTGRRARLAVTSS
jgi:hypothetical protein